MLIHRSLLMLFLLVFVSGSIMGITINLNKRNPSCNNNNGSIASYVNGGAPPYTYNWSNGQTTAYINNLSTGTYTLYVTDGVGAIDSITTTINNTPNITDAWINCLNPDNFDYTFPCKNQCDGNAYLYDGYINGPPQNFRDNYMNGTPPYNITSSMNHTVGYYGATLLPFLRFVCFSDVYTVTVTDALGCTGTVRQAYASNGPGSFDFTSTNTIIGSCNNLPDGSATLVLNKGGGAQHTVTWSGPTNGTYSSSRGSNTTLLLTYLRSGNYSVRITNDDSHSGCDTLFNLIIPNLGSNCGTINGKVYLDSISNCIADANEQGLPSRILRFTPGPYYSTSDNQGNYSSLLPYGNYTVETISNYQFMNVCPVMGVILNSINDSVVGVNVGDSTSFDLDLSINLSASAARPGFNYNVYVTVVNQSNIPVTNSEVILDYSSVLSFIGSNIPFTNTGPSQITLTIPSLGSFSTAVARVDFSIPPNQGLIGSILTSNAMVNANQAEPNLTNNTFTLMQAITGSFDPNEKSVWPERDVQKNYILGVDSVFRYTIRFQNTGTDTAFNVVLIDTLNPYLDVTSIQEIGTSHPCRWEITGQNVLKIYYNNIQLPDSGIDEAGSHGLFSFSIKHSPSLNTVLLPYELENKAAIYFDFNLPILTNTIFNTINLNVSVSENSKPQITFSPNPASESIKITSKNVSEIKRIAIFDLLGRQRILVIPNSTTTTIQLRDLSDGIYLMMIYGKETIYSEKILKQ